MKKTANSQKTDATPVKPVENPVENSQNPAPKTAPVDPQQPSPDAAKITELTNDLQRTRADFENFRKQTEAQRSHAMSATRLATVEKFLPLLDDLDRAFAAYPDQLAPLAKNLTKTLTSLSLEKINSAPETEFNPDFHDAISVADEGGDNEVIAETLRPGYLYEKSVLRPAMVKVKRI